MVIYGPELESLNLRQLSIGSLYVPAASGARERTSCVWLEKPVRPEFLARLRCHPPSGWISEGIRQSSAPAPACPPGPSGSDDFREPAHLDQYPAHHPAPEVAIPAPYRRFLL